MNMQPPYPPNPPQQKSNQGIIVGIIVIALCVIVVVGAIEYALLQPNTNQMPVAVALVSPAPTPTPTPDDRFQSFLDSFSQALASQDMTTIANDTNPNGFGTTLQCINSNEIIGLCNWATVYTDIQNGSLVLSIQSPILYSCSNYRNAYAIHAVMGTYKIISSGNNGLATFTFAQLEQGGNWFWVYLSVNKAQCPASS